MSLQGRGGGGGRKQYIAYLLYCNDANTLDSLFRLPNIMKVNGNKSLEKETKFSVRLMLV